MIFSGARGGHACALAVVSLLYYAFAVFAAPVWWVAACWIMSSLLLVAAVTAGAVKDYRSVEAWSEIWRAIDALREYAVVVPFRYSFEMQGQFYYFEFAPALQPEHVIPDADAAATLVDLARHGDETAFREIARCYGVPADRLDELWDGTRRRLPKVAATKEPA